MVVKGDQITQRDSIRKELHTMLVKVLVQVYLLTELFGGR